LVYGKPIITIQKAASPRQLGPTNEEIITRLEGVLAAAKLHLEAEINGRKAACNQLQSANLGRSAAYREHRATQSTTTNSGSSVGRQYYCLGVRSLARLKN
jgi:hypothetical protein